MKYVCIFLMSAGVAMASNDDLPVRVVGGGLIGLVVNWMWRDSPGWKP